ncbi:hypothetical protein NLM16_16255 [Bradyrhizobium brasilense]|uniref:hypothetical protein n=1 Tax=Bradyrhizobium brasilense TaxID=1419277 RepID=UPI0028778162|nr:hypothetical protein [Bradyrhizobium brasilense]MCP3415665.1 hypothetical protein [Bradyrhizobium brasilense]
MLKAADFAASSTERSASWVRRPELSETSIGSIRPVLSPRSGTADFAGSLSFVSAHFCSESSDLALVSSYFWPDKCPLGVNSHFSQIMRRIAWQSAAYGAFRLQLLSNAAASAIQRSASVAFMKMRHRQEALGASPLHAA